MYPTNYDGKLKANEIYAGIYNMIISQQVFGNNVKIKNKFINRVDGGLFGDKKLYYATDALALYDWGGDEEATKLLELNRPEDPQCQAIELDTFKQLRLTLDNYLTKRAWMNADAFSSFSSQMLGWMSDTKKIYDSRLNKVFRGTYETAEGKQSLTVALPTDENDQEAENRLQAQTIAKSVADLQTALDDEDRDYNDYGNMRSYDKEDFDIIFNADYSNKITKMDVPTIYHKDIIDTSLNMPSKYFGKVGTVTGSAITSDGLTYRSLLGGWVTLAEDTVIKGKTITKGTKVFLFPGDIIPNKIQVATTTAIVVPFYVEDSKIMYKLIHKQDIPYMSAFEAGTNFMNARSLTENHYTTFGHNTLQHLHNFPLITVRAGN